jgi:hypothetical protein
MREKEFRKHSVAETNKKDMYLEGLMYYSKYCKEVNRSKY